MTSVGLEDKRRNQLLWVLSGATFLIFFQAFMVAPLIPRLAGVFSVSVEAMGLVIPVYLIPYGVATLVYGPLSDRLGRRPIMLASFIGFILLTALTASTQSLTGMLWLRLLTGLVASGVVPLALALLGDLFPYHERGRPLGWLFGAMAGGMAFGSTAGVLLEPFITWRGLFLGVAVLAAVICAALLPYQSLLRTRATSNTPLSVRKMMSVFGELLSSRRGQRTYVYVFFNAIFHSGVFTWLGLYFAQRHGLSEVGIGLALLGYGIPGFVLGPVIGRLADRWGRSRLIPAGLAIGGASAAVLALDLPVLAAALLVTILSLGYDMTQPLLAGIVTDLSPMRGLAMGLNVFALFTGFGLGSLIFSGVLLVVGLNAAFVVFGMIALLATVVAVPLFQPEERPKEENTSNIQRRTLS